MVTYSRLWLLLKRRGYSPRDIIRLAGISESTYRKMSRNETVRMDVLERICLSLRVDIGDVCSFERTKREEIAIIIHILRHSRLYSYASVQYPCSLGNKV